MDLAPEELAEILSPSHFENQPLPRPFAPWPGYLAPLQKTFGLSEPGQSPWPPFLSIPLGKKKSARNLEKECFGAGSLLENQTLAPGAL